MYRENSNILSCIPSTNIFIEAGIEAGGVLVHCFGGRSRSAAFICAYIMSSRSCSYLDAYNVIYAVRPLISINKGFEMQLRAYSDSNYDVYAAEQNLLFVSILFIICLYISVYYLYVYIYSKELRH